MQVDRVAILNEQLGKYPITLDPVQIAEILGVSRRYVDQLITDGKLNVFALDNTKKYKQYRMLKADMIAYLLRDK